MANNAIRRKARQFARVVRHSVMTPRTGQSRRPQLARDGELAATFIGHSGFFLQVGGVNVVVDPNFARWLFVLKRLRRPGMRIKDLPAIDYVLVTHAHFDHLHRPSLRAIARLTRRLRGNPPVIIVPQNVGDVVRRLGYRDIVELQWWEEYRVRTATENGRAREFSVTHVPSRHWGARLLNDFHRGYGGYVIRVGRHCVYHAGDTGYFPGFAEIGHRLRPQVALLPIGAYNPPAYRNVHTDPSDAVRAFLDLGARWMVPMHYGTFRLGHEPLDEPLRLLAREAKRAGVQDRVLVLEEGVTEFFG
jgi:L-ascorbate metabolism protein UlaG (beta-lactamase superfamily)